MIGHEYVILTFMPKAFESSTEKEFYLKIFFIIVVYLACRHFSRLVNDDNDALLGSLPGLIQAFKKK